MEAPYNHLTGQATARYTHVTDSLGSELTIAADWLSKNETHRMTTIRPDQAFNNHSCQTTRMFEAQVTYNKLFAAGYALNTGAVFRTLRTDYRLTDEQQHTTAPYAYGQMPALFTEFQGGWQRLQYAVGLRAQQTLIGYRPERTAEGSRHSDWSLYPSVDLMYALNPDRGHMLMLSYKRSVDDIPYSAISPYKHYESDYEYTRGNPALIAPKQHQALLAIDLFERFTLSGMYLYSRHPIYYATAVDPAAPNVSYTMPKNGHHETLLGINLETRLQPLSWWQLKATAQGVVFSAVNDDFTVRNQDKYMVSLNNNFTFSPTAGATLEGYYEPTFRFTDRIYHTVYDLGGSCYKRFFNNRLECRLHFKLLRQGRVLDTATPTFRSTYANRTREQFLKLTLVHTFSGGKKVNVKQTQSIQSYEQLSDTK